jgi:diguanylate cyclase (GGDEF)-like protein
VLGEPHATGHALNGPLLSGIKPRRRKFALVGALLSLGVPAGLALVRTLEQAQGFGPAALLSTLRGDWPGFAWVTASAAALATGLAWVLGRVGDRATQLSITDPLTGLFNRRHFTTQLESAMKRDQRQGSATCVMCVDLDRLKVINDQFGHERGDAALVAVAKALSMRLRARDVVARFGGDEFAVLLPETTGEIAIRIGERILDELKGRAQALDGELSVSIGVAELESGVAAADLLVAADRALYWAKCTGGGRVALAPRAVIGLSHARGPA